MPPSDATLPEDYLQENVDLALAARAVSKWAQDVPWPVFLNYVLPYARYTLRMLVRRLLLFLVSDHLTDHN